MFSHAGSRAGSTAGLRRTSILPAAALGAVLVLSAGDATAQDWRSTTALRQIGAENELDVHVGYGVGHLAIGPAEGNTLYRANLRYDAEYFEPTVEYQPGRLRLDMEGLRDGSLRGDTDGEGRLDLTLARGITLDLDIEFGAAEADIELGGLSIRALEVSTGASETRLRFSEPNPLRMERITFEVGAAAFHAGGLGNANTARVSLDGGAAEMRLDFTGEWRGNTELDVDLGLGSLTLVVPRGVGVYIQKEGVLTSLDGGRMEKRGDAYYSDNWNEARHRLTAHINAAFGSVTVEWAD